MLKRLQVRNYRSLQDIQLFKLRQFNLLTGRNGGGKTSMLEAIFLNCAAANPQIALSINGFRGQSAAHPLVDTTFRTLFRDQDPKNVIEIIADEVKNLKSYERFLRLEPILSERTIAGRSKSEKFVSGLTATFSGHKSRDLKAKFAWKIDAAIFAKLNAQTQPPVKADELFDVDQPPQPDLIFARYLSPYLVNVRQEMVGQLADVTKRRSLEGVLKIVRILEPTITNLVALVEEGEQIIYADTGSGDLRPLHVMGQGFIHLLKIALALDDIENGIILIDELENGFHYSVHSQVISVILSVLQSKPNLQIIATTHSAELISSLGEVIQESDYRDVCLYNVSGRTNRVTPFERDEVVEAVKSEFELR